MKRLLSILTIVMMIMLVGTGCGQSADSEEPDTQGESEVTADAPSDDGETATDAGAANMDPADFDHSFYDFVLAATRGIRDTGDGDWDTVPVDVSEAIGQAGAKVYYAYKDLNGDGIDELIMGTEYDGKIQPAGIYTVRDGLAYMPNLYMFSNILEDGTIKVYGSDFAQQTEQYIKLQANGELIETEASDAEPMSFDWEEL